MMGGTLGTRPYTHGLHDLGNGCYAWLQPDGSWGWSNAGLVVDSGESLLVDTLFDERLTAGMLAAMRRAEPRAAARIGTLVNTHANGDHCYGNALVAGAEIIASRASSVQMEEDIRPAQFASLLRSTASLGEVGRYFQRCFGPFEFAGIEPALPTRTFDGALTLHVGTKRVELIEVGPAHTAGDVLVHVPDDRAIYTGDILFIDGTPIMWAGPVERWIAACDRILALDVETVIPGHGPITDVRGVVAVKAYLEHVRGEARQRFDAGMSAVDAARDIALGDFAAWGDAERIAVNVRTLYRQWDPTLPAADALTLFREMSALARK
jgi:glyoxylase-like metal-dependent hydrolase (beta-lactamase superfamily II)